jgi:hypothetical protein
MVQDLKELNNVITRGFWTKQWFENMWNILVRDMSVHVRDYAIVQSSAA